MPCIIRVCFLMFFGYSKYNLGVDENVEMQLLEEEAKAAYNKRKKQEKVLYFILKVCYNTCVH